MNNCKADPKGSRTSFFAAGAFVDDTIWVGNCLAATQCILDIVSKFFSINDIVINTDKTVAIPINREAREVSLSISNSRISIVKKSVSYQYLGIFFSTDGLFKPSLAKAYSDIRFFSNVVLRKAVTEKQFLYLVSAVLQPIIGYRFQFSCIFKSVCEKWDKMLRKGLKLKANLPKDFPNEALYHPELYSLRIFEQVLAENILAGLVVFANAGEILSKLFKHRAMELQATSWMLQHSLRVPINLLINSTNCFLAGATCVFKLCNLSLGGDLPDVFQAKHSIAVLDVLSLKSYLCVVKSLKRYGIVWKKLDPRGPVPVWFVSLVEFIKEDGLSNCVALSHCSALADFPCDFSYVNERLLNSNLSFVTIYTNSSIKSLGSLDAHGGAAAYFPDANISIRVKMDGLLFSTLVELQAIALALEYVPISWSVVLFTDSQASLDLCESGGGVFSLDFHDKCWIKKEHICCVIFKKGLSVTWNKVKGHSGVVGNKRANFYADVTVASKFFLPFVVPYCFLRVEDRPVFKNARHVAKKLFNAVHSVSWEAKCVGSFIKAGLCDRFNKTNTFCVWHLNGKIKSGYTIISHESAPPPLTSGQKEKIVQSEIFKYCMQCELVEDSDHMFFCAHNANVWKTLLLNTSMEWNAVLEITANGNVIINSLHKTGSSINLFIVLAKSFVLKD
ncbi:hypothetical protein G9A89_017648 [Geosiphon pyriformis]|nr:hypothetical protein G9A89_017648 [Geosiphon pyriformis]